MSNRITPAPGKILLKKYKKEEKKGSLFLPDQCEKGTQIYVIQCVSLGEEDYAHDDRVIISNNYPFPIDIDDQVYYMVDSKDILGTVDWK